MLQYTQDGTTALMYACKEGYLLIVKALLLAHPDVNIATKVRMICWCIRLLLVQVSTLILCIYPYTRLVSYYNPNSCLSRLMCRYLSVDTFFTLSIVNVYNYCINFMHRMGTQHP